MSILQDKAEQIHNDITGGTVALDPATINLIIQLLIEVVKAYQDCNRSPEQALTSMQAPNFFDRWRFRRLARKHFDDYKPVVNSAYYVGSTLELSEVQEMYATTALFEK
jgi:hypothetical protein